MKANHIIPVLLGLAVLLANLVIYNVVERRGLRWPAALGVVGLAVVFAELALLAAWLVWGRGNIASRVLASLAALGIPAITAASCTEGADDYKEWYAMLLFYLLIVASLCWGARLWNVTISATPAAKSDVTRNRQFSIWSLLSATTGVACVLGASRVVHLPGSPLQVLFFLTVAALISLTGMFLSFLSIRPWRGAALVLLTSGCMGIGLSLSGVPPPDNRMLLVVVMSVAQGFCVGSLVVILRIAGFQMTRD